jgi:hypothetical protein
MTRPRRHRKASAERIRQLECDLAVPIEDLIEDAERAVLAEAQPGGRGFTAREQATFDMHLAQIVQLDQRISALINAGGDGSTTLRNLRDRRHAALQELKALADDCVNPNWMTMESIR